MSSTTYQIELGSSSDAEIEGHCLNCGTATPLKDFRLITVEPILYIDFCKACERTYGTHRLYVKFKNEVDERVYKIVDIAAHTKPDLRTTEQTMLLVEPTKQRVPKLSNDRIVNEELVRELAIREQARRHIIPYIRRFMPTYMPGWVHHDIASRLERFVQQVEKKKAPRLMIMMPPRHGKSQLTSKDAISWILGHHPEWEIISASYAQSLPMSFSRDIRDRINSDEYKAIFPDTAIRKDNSAVEEWGTTKRGRYQAVGVGGSLTGKGAHIAVVDDPIKDYAEAQSEIIRLGTHSWYTTVLRSRMAPGGGVLLIGTRWHDDDLHGFILSQQQAAIDAGYEAATYDQWEIVSYPAIAEHDEYYYPNGLIEHDPIEVPFGARMLRRKGEPLHPERYNLDELLKLKNLYPASQWNSLYQQNPVPDDGEFFKRQNIKLVPDVDLNMLPNYHVILAGDFALGDKQHNDWSTLGVLILNSSDFLQLIHLEHGRWSTIPLLDLIMKLIKKYKPGKIAFEKTHQTMTFMPLLRQRMIAENKLVSIDDTLIPIKDKKARALTLQGRVELGQFGVTENAPWAEKVISELLRFPTGKHDDIVDMLTWGAVEAIKMRPPRGAKKLSPRRENWVKDLKAPVKSSYMAS